MPENRDESFLRLFVPAQPLLRRFVMAHVPEYHAAEDILQQTALVLWRKFDDYDVSRPFANWAMGIAWREVLMARRRAARDRLVFTDDLAESLATELAAREPEESARRAVLEFCVRKLQGIQRQVFDLKYRQSLPCDRIAERIRRSSNAVRILLYRIREALRDCVRKTAASAAAAEAEGAP